jgi:site-specific recombinase XerD
VRALRRLKREQESASPFVFTSSLRPHPHMLRHACGFKLANDGHDTRALQAYLGHKNIQHTVRYTELAPGRFRNFWRD